MYSVNFRRWQEYSCNLQSSSSGARSRPQCSAGLWSKAGELQRSPTGCSWATSHNGRRVSTWLLHSDNSSWISKISQWNSWCEIVIRKVFPWCWLHWHCFTIPLEIPLVLSMEFNSHFVEVLLVYSSYDSRAEKGQCSNRSLIQKVEEGTSAQCELFLQCTQFTMSFELHLFQACHHQVLMMLSVLNKDVCQIWRGTCQKKAEQGGGFVPPNISISKTVVAALLVSATAWYLIYRRRRQQSDGDCSWRMARATNQFIILFRVGRPDTKHQNRSQECWMPFLN